jgi:hypothetical protein
LDGGQIDLGAERLRRHEAKLAAFRAVYGANAGQAFADAHRDQMVPTGVVWPKDWHMRTDAIGNERSG